MAHGALNTLVAIDGQLLCVQRGPTGSWCVHCYRVDEASRHFVLKSSVDVRGALGGEASDVDLSTTELVAADAVTDTAASLQTVALAFRRRRGATHDYWLGTVRVEPPVSAASWHAFELAEVEAQVLTDGPALVMVHAIGGGGHALSVASLASPGGVRLRRVPLPGRASLLGATSWSGAADDLHALLVLRTAEGDGQQVLALRLPAHDGDAGPPTAADPAAGGATIGGGSGATAARGGATESGSGTGGGSTASGGGTAGSGGGGGGGGGVLGGARAVAALDALASRVLCAAPHWQLEVDAEGSLRRSLRLWVGTSCGWLHCCGGGDEPAPLVSLHLELTPRRYTPDPTPPTPTPNPNPNPNPHLSPNPDSPNPDSPPSP